VLAQRLDQVTELLLAGAGEAWVVEADETVDLLLERGNRVLRG
jgi:hypothetical protein